MTTFGGVADPVTASHPHRDEPEGPGHEHRDITGGWQRAATYLIRSFATVLHQKMRLVGE